MNRSRLAARLAAASVSFSPRSLSIGEGLRAAAACASMVAAAGVFHAPDLLWAAVGALWTCLADPGGLGWMRLRAMGGFALLSTAFSVVAAAAVPYGSGCAAAVVFVCAFVGTMVRVYGIEAAQVGTLSVVACAVAVEWPAHSVAHVGSLAAIYLGGCLWALVLGLSIWRIHPFKPVRVVLDTTFRSLAAMAAELAKLDASSGPEAWAEYARDHRAAVRANIERSRSVVRRVTSTRRATASAARLTVAVEVADRIFACLIALSDRLETIRFRDAAERELEHQGLRQLAEILSCYALALRRDRLSGEELGPLHADLLHTARSLAGPTGTGLVRIAEEIDILADPGFVSPEAVARTSAAPRIAFAPVLANLTWRSLDLRHAVRSAVTIAVVVLVTHAAAIPFAYWMSMAVVLVQQPSIATTWFRAVERVVGSMLGGVLAALLLLELHSTAALTAAVFPLAALTMAVRSINYSLFVVFLTPLFVLTVDVMHPGAKDLSLVGLRVLNNLVGGIVALVSSLVLWPIWEPGRLRELIADAVDANARYASLAFAPDHDEGVLTEARRRAGLASSNAEAARERGAIEAWWRREALQGAVPVLLLVRGVAGIATAAWLDPRLERRGSQAADWLREEGAALSARLCGEDVKPLAPPDLRDDVDATRCIQQMLLVEAAVERFISAQSGSRRIGTRDAAA